MLTGRRSPRAPQPDAFVRTLRNDSFIYPRTAQIKQADWAAVVLRHDYSSMGLEFTRSAKELQEEVRLLRLQNAKEEEAKRAAAKQERERAREAKRKEVKSGGGELGGKRRGGRGGRRKWMLTMRRQ